MISGRAVLGLPEIAAGDDLAAILLHHAVTPPTAGDVVAVAHKVISKAEGRVRRLEEVDPGPRAKELAQRELQGKDARHIQVILDEAAEIVRCAPGVLICRTHHGFVCANAGVDASNAADSGTVIVLPADPDASARRLRQRLREELKQPGPAVLISDSFGRAWRNGQSDVAIGLAGLSPLEDWRGRTDAHGRELQATWIAVADQAAAMADLARSGKDAGEPVVILSGLERHVTAADGPGIQPLLRPPAEDLFR